MRAREIEAWLRESDPGRLTELYARADRVRRERVGDGVALRGLIEISNHCARSCHYCGLRVQNREVMRYRLSAEEILRSVERAVSLGYGTVVLQAGEDPALDAAWVAERVRSIKQRFDVAITLSLGERDPAELALWRAAGADRYLLRFETSNRKLFDRIHPALGRQRRSRFRLLRVLRDLDYEVGSGVMIGLPGQSYRDLARDLELFGQLRLHMIGVGPFVPHPQTPLGASREESLVPADAETTCKVIALARILCPDTNIPATTALASLDPERGRERGLLCGANVVMPNVTPLEYRACYEIYPAKACLAEDPARFHEELMRRLHSIGRHAARGRCDAPLRTRSATPKSLEELAP